MGNLISKNKKIKKQQITNTSVKVAHTFRVLTQKDIDAERSNAYSYVL